MSKPTCLWCESTNTMAEVFHIPAKRYSNPEVRTLGYARCSDCGGFSQVPIPDDAELAQFYDEAYLPYRESLTQGTRILTKTSSLLNRKLKRMISTCYPVATGGESVLDVGAGTARFGRITHDLGYEVTLTDLSDRLRRESESLGLTFVMSDSKDLVERLDKKTYSIVHAAHVLEHVYQPRKFLDDLIRLTAPGGIVHVSFPSNESSLVKLARTRWVSGFEPRHLYLPRTGSIRSWLSSHDFVESVVTARETSPSDATRWLLGRYELMDLRQRKRKVAMLAGLAIACSARLFGTSDRVHVFIKTKASAQQTF
jgi:ubiquinone/menaquinone biosynthesis C-methylase UbiE